MRFFSIFAVAFAVLLVGCEQRIESSKNANAPDAVILKVAVFKDGKIKIGGENLSIDDAIKNIQGAKGTNTAFYYYREAGSEEPHPNAMKIIAAIAETKRPISLSTEPDFSTYVNENGEVMKRTSSH